MCRCWGCTYVCVGVGDGRKIEEGGCVFSEKRKEEGEV